MAWTPITGIPPQLSNLANELANDYWLKLYDAGTTDPYSMAIDSSGAPRLAKCKLNAEGYPISDPGDDDTVFVPHVDQNYRIVLYRNETDADNDTTANAAFNVDDLLPDATVAADISQITTRSTTLQAQDDYDRSPLFVDVTDFTSGLGPHVITMPLQVPAWTPNSVGFRFYKLSSAGAITTPTVTSSDATTFTISDTLLSTDTLFVGDEEFRNQMDGDALDIRTRLDVYSKTEAYTKTETDSAIATEFRTTTEVFSGSSTSVDMDAFGGGWPGDGVYVVANSIGDVTLILEDGVANGGSISTSSSVTNTLFTGTLNKNASNVLTSNATVIDFDDATPTLAGTTMNITSIRRLG